MLLAFTRTYALILWLIPAPATAKPFDYLKKIQGRGPSNKAIHGNAWSEQAGQPVHHPSSESEVDREIREEKEAQAKRASQAPKVPLKQPKVHAPLGITDARAMAHLRKIIHGNGAPAPGPGPAPGPAPWTEDPEWMIDGARGDKTQTVPIIDQFKGLENIPAPEQGFHGRPVQHDDMDSMTGDWNIEFGPKGPDTAYEVCKQHPENWWCKQHIHELGGLRKVMIGGKRDNEPLKPPWAGARGFLASALPAAVLVFWAFVY